MNKFEIFKEASMSIYGFSFLFWCYIHTFSRLPPRNKKLQKGPFILLLFNHWVQNTNTIWQFLASKDFKRPFLFCIFKCWSFHPLWEQLFFIGDGFHLYEAKIKLLFVWNCLPPHWNTNLRLPRDFGPIHSQYLWGA